MAALRSSSTCLSGPVSVLLVTSVVVLSAWPLGAQQRRWFELYDEAVQHVAKGEWGPAEQKLLAAQTSGPPPGNAVLRYGTDRRPYFPDYYLGIVYLNTKRPREALQRFQAFQAQKPNLRDRSFAQLDSHLAQATDGVRTLEAADAAAAQARNAPPAPTKSPPTPVESPRETAPPVAPPSPPVTPSPTPSTAPSLDQVRREVRAQINAGDFAGASRLLDEARRRGSDAGALAGLGREVAREEAAASVRRALAERRPEAAAAALTRLEGIDPAWPTTSALRREVTALRATSLMADVERRAMLAYFSGDYQQAVTAIDSATRAGDLSPRAQFYRACSLAALVLRDRPPDDRDARARDARLIEARRQYARLSSAVKQLQRDRRFISPEVIRLLETP